MQESLTRTGKSVIIQTQWNCVPMDTSGRFPLPAGPGTGEGRHLLVITLLAGRLDKETVGQ
jgi:hypothetical protein